MQLGAVNNRKGVGLPEEAELWTHFHIDAAQDIARLKGKGIGAAQRELQGTGDWLICNLVTKFPDLWEFELEAFTGNERQGQQGEVDGLGDWEALPVNQELVEGADEIEAAQQLWVPGGWRWQLSDQQSTYYLYGVKVIDQLLIPQKAEFFLLAAGPLQEVQSRWVQQAEARPLWQGAADCQTQKAGGGAAEEHPVWDAGQSVKEVVR